jgi:hypothetical protein
LRLITLNGARIPLADGEVRLSFAGSVRADGMIESLDLGMAVVTSLKALRGGRRSERGTTGATVAAASASTARTLWEYKLPPEQAARAEANLRRDIRLRAAAALFAHQVVDVDPLSHWIPWLSGWEHGRPSSRRWLSGAVRQLIELEPMIQNEALILVPRLTRDDPDFETVLAELEAIP